MTHRDPLECIPSACSLAASYREITSHQVDRSRLGAEVSQVLAVGVEWALEAAAAGSTQRQIFDVSYPKMLADPIGVACSVYNHFGYTLDSSMVDRMRLWLAENPQGKQGAHRYSLREFGLDPSELKSRFASYRAWTAEHLRPDPCQGRAVSIDANA